MSSSEAILLERAKAGDRTAFEKLIEVYQKKIFNLAYRMVGNYEDASDLAQEAMIRIYRSIPRFQEQSSFSTWIYRITTNVCLDELRKRKNKSTVSLDEEIMTEDGEMKRQIESDELRPDEALEKEELRRIVNGAIMNLPEDHRLAVTLRDLQGLSYEEISQTLQLPAGTVKSRINRARQALKSALSGSRELFYDEYVK